MRDYIFTLGNDLDTSAPIDLAAMQTGVFSTLLGDDLLTSLGGGAEGQWGFLEAAVDGCVIQGGSTGQIRVPGGACTLGAGDVALERYLGDGVTKVIAVFPADRALLGFKSGDFYLTSRFDTPPDFINVTAETIEQDRVGESHRLFEALNPVMQGWSVGVGSPGIIYLPGHTLQAGDHVFFETSNQIPGGLIENLIYVVTNAGPDQFELSYASSMVSISTTSKTGCKLRRTRYGFQSGTTFTLPSAPSYGRLLIRR